MYPEVSLFIGGSWSPGAGEAIPVLNPATGDEIGVVAHAERADLDRALDAADRGFRLWRKVSAHERYQTLRRAAGLIRERADEISRLMTQEQGKPLGESKAETLAAGDIIDWFAEEARRTYGRVIPARAEGVTQLALKEPVGPVAAFTPWNFPINQAVRKVSAALAAGCSVILKGPEETPASCAALVRAYQDAGVLAGVVNLVFGVPAEISEYLIPHPVIRKVTFTGSTPVGKQLAALAGLHMKRITMELGGHAPVIVFDDADIEQAAKLLSVSKFRNAGQVCVSPTRFYVQSGIYDAFLQGFAERTAKVKVGSGLEADTKMGPLANERRPQAIEALVEDARQKGARVLAGGGRGDGGFFFQPTLLADVPNEAEIMNEEPFGPVAVSRPFDTFEEVIEQANRLPYGLAAFAFTENGRRANLLGDAIEAGMVGINTFAISVADAPFGGIKDSGTGSEGGPEGLQSYQVTKAIHQA